MHEIPKKPLLLNKITSFTENLLFFFIFINMIFQLFLMFSPIFKLPYLFFLFILCMENSSFFQLKHFSKTTSPILAFLKTFTPSRQFNHGIGFVLVSLFLTLDIFTPCSSVSIVNFEQKNAGWDNINNIRQYNTCKSLPPRYRIPPKK